MRDLRPFSQCPAPPQRAELTGQAGSSVNIGGQGVPGAEGEDPVPQGALGEQAVVKEELATII